MKFVPPKNEEQQDIQALHRARCRLVNHRTAVACQMRGPLLDRGVTIPLTLGRARQRIQEILENPSNGFSDMTREIIADLFELMLQLDARIQDFDRRIDQVFRANPDCRRNKAWCGTLPSR